MVIFKKETEKLYRWKRVGEQSKCWVTTERVPGLSVGQLSLVVFLSQR